MTGNPKTAALELLRKPFPDNQIGWLPKVTCKDCTGRSCSEHRKSKCAKCGNYISSAHVDLQYVGHAALCDRLLDADPEWSWEPVAFGPDGLPAFDRLGGLWIRLTVCGVTRLGYGDAQGKTGANAIKEAIGDALRNAGMRFGAALDLWHRGDLHVEEQDDEPKPKAEKERKATRGPVPPAEDQWRVSDPEWLDKWRTDVAMAPDLDTLTGLWTDLSAAVNAGTVNPADGDEGKALLVERKTDLMHPMDRPVPGDAA